MKNVLAEAWQVDHTAPHEVHYHAALKFTVQLQLGVWISSCGRTLVEKSAKQYLTASAAKGALTRARRHGVDYLGAVVVPVTVVSA